MPKTFPIKLEVEEIALGSVLRRLNEMAGIAKIDLDLGHGGRKPLADGRAKNGNGETLQAQLVAMLITGPKSVEEMSAAIGGKKARIYGAMHALKSRKAVRTNGKGVYHLSDKAMAELSGTMPQAQTIAPRAPALPPPVKRGPKGRAVPGSGPIVLKGALINGPLPSSDLRASLANKGMSSKSISGVLDRAKRDRLVKLNGDKAYELTAKGQKIALPEAEAAHG